jgi:hypothetical protein
MKFLKKIIALPACGTLQTARPTPLCAMNFPGIVLPDNGATARQNNKNP